MNSEVDVHAYVQDLEKHLQLTLFGGRVADPEGAVLLVRGALAEGDSERAENLADATRRLAATTPGHPDMAGAARPPPLPGRPRPPPPGGWASGPPRSWSGWRCATRLPVPALPRWRTPAAPGSA